MHVDEARRDDEAARVDLAARLRARELPDGGDAVAADADVAGKPGIAGAVDDVSAANDQIEGGRLAVQPHQGSGRDREYCETDAKNLGHKICR